MQLPTIAHQIWDMKYRFKLPDGTPIDKDISDTHWRIARALACNEQDKDQWGARFYNSLEDFKFLPGGRIAAGAGTGRSVTMQNCYVMGTIEDDLGSIFSHLREAALTMQQGGGIGYDFSTLRPAGALVQGVGADASGPLSFMDVWDSMCLTIMSAGARRGAMMATIRCDHPDLLAFIKAKRTKGRLTQFNMSVLVTDAFMRAVAADVDWDLIFNGVVYSTHKARDLWNQIMESTYNNAEPGVIFIDRINRLNNLWYCETHYATNPCGEQNLPPYGACLLGSMNLTKFIRNPFTPNAYLDGIALEEHVGVAVRMMDNVVDVSNFPLPQQREQQQLKRRLGLGITGLGDALIMCGLKYGTPSAIQLAEEWMATVEDTAYLASIELAKEKGSFPALDIDQYCSGGHIIELPEYIQSEIREHGIRNSHLTSIAPTGTISLLAGNISSGLEPVFAYKYTRKVLQNDGSKTEEEVEDYAYTLYRELGYDTTNLPDYFVSAQTLTPEAHVRTQAALQKHVDSSISKTINCPEDISFEDFKNVYALAYELGCKGCTTYRPNDTTGSVLSVEPKKAETLASRPDNLTGETYKLKWPDGDISIYITVNDIVENGKRRPFEVFFNSKSVEHHAWASALSRMISAVFRRGGDVSFVVEELKAIFDPRGGAWMDGRYVPSLLAAIGDVIRRHMVAIGFIESDTPILTPEMQGQQCPKCLEFTLIRQEGCMACTSCAYSKCG